ncbi:alpha/beta hydrolase [Altererythrobacter luteolus]|uniref:Alpha/beta hydrolase n=1 Tax=Pontixanthobacter luteolus TaxID=295089 RepID=A0A6I4UW30_9SPHN|nr:alpha/beta fold hydrolase [Pontixanthobacter luteolus]MXP46077.1 alpha/beta hydrolase [Pontixanthobacter luteolus]
MAMQNSPPSANARVWTAEELSRRVALASAENPQPAERPKLRHLAGELRFLAEPAVRPFRKIDIVQAEVPRTVMLLPGFATHPVRMRYMAQQLERAGHKVKRWGLGFNFGPTPENVEYLEQRLDEIYRRYDRPVYLVGWSLGGLFARELGRRHPEMIAKVVTMGSPFSGNPRANNAWRIYQFLTGHSVDNPPVETDNAAKPPVETVAFWSASDGIISPRSACGKPGERDRAVALRCNHLGFSYSPECISAVLRELEGR